MGMRTGFPTPTRHGGHSGGAEARLGRAAELLDRPMSDDPHDHVLLRIRGAGTARSAGCESGSVSLRARAGGRCERCSPPMGMRCAVYPTHAGSTMSMRAAGVRAGRHRRAECRGAAGYCPFAAAALR